MTTETLDKLYLEWSNFTKARTGRELLLLATCHKIAECNSLDDARALAMNALRSLGASTPTKGPAGDAGQVGWLGGEFDR